MEFWLKIPIIMKIFKKYKTNRVISADLIANFGKQNALYKLLLASENGGATPTDTQSSRNVKE